MKILHVGEYVSGGVATYLRNVLDYQSNEKHTDMIYLLMSDKNSEEFNSSLKLQVHRYKYDREIKSIISNILFFKKAINIINPDIIHVHSSFAGVMIRSALLLCRVKAKVVYCSHGWSFLIPNLSKSKKKVYLLIEKLLAMNTDKIVNISPYEFTNSIKAGISKNKSILIESGINPKKVLNANVINEGINIFNRVDTIKLGFVGRFDQAKGLDILLNNFIQIPNDHLELLIIGDTVLKDGIDISDDFKKYKNIHFLGWKKHEDIDSYISILDGVVIPSRWEGFGLVALEAMKNSKCVISSSAGGLIDLVNSKNGYIYNVNCEHQLQNILKNLNVDMMRAKGINGNSLFNDKYTSDIMNKNIIELYHSLLF